MVWPPMESSTQIGALYEHARQVAMATESQNPDRVRELNRYLARELLPALEKRSRTWAKIRHNGEPRNDRELRS